MTNDHSPKERYKEDEATEHHQADHRRRESVAVDRV
jgi:hypothetical protein